MGRLREDIQAVMQRDPAARSALEVFLCYPSVHALFWHRLASRLHQRGWKLLARVISQRARHKTGIEIHPGARIGRNVFIDHGMGVVIGETAEIGDHVTIYQGVTLGGTGKDSGKRHPTVEENVTIGAGAKILGPFTVGRNAKIGAGSIVLREVPPDCTVVGNPGRIVKKNGCKTGVHDLDQVNLPDPVREQLEAQSRCIAELEEKMERLLAQTIPEAL